MGRSRPRRIQPTIYWWRRLAAVALIAAGVTVTILRPGCDRGMTDAPRPEHQVSSADTDGHALMHADELPTGDPQHVRDLLRRHVAEPAAASAPRPARPGPIRCRLDGELAYIDPDTGRVTPSPPDEALLEPDPASRWWSDSAHWQFAGEAATPAGLPPDLAGVRSTDVSPDGRLLLLVCATQDGPRDPSGEPYGGVALWDTVAQQGWWLVHPVASVAGLNGRLHDAYFYDDRYCVTANVDGVVNGDIIFWDLRTLPADGSAVEPWLGVIHAVVPAHRAVLGFTRTTYWPGAPNTPMTWQIAGGKVIARSFDLFEADCGFAVAPDGESGCGVKFVPDADVGPSGHYEFTVFRGDQEHGWLLGPDERPASASWAPDSSAIAADMLTPEPLTDPSPADAPPFGLPPGQHRLVVMDATTGERRELASSDAPFEPEWLGRGQ